MQSASSSGKITLMKTVSQSMRTSGNLCVNSIRESISEMRVFGNLRFALGPLSKFHWASRCPLGNPFTPISDPDHHKHSMVLVPNVKSATRSDGTPSFQSSNALSHSALLPEQHRHQGTISKSMKRVVRAYFFRISVGLNLASQGVSQSREDPMSGF